MSTNGLSGLGGRLSEERQRRKRSQRDLARSVGVSASLISQIEAGKVQPSVVTLMAIVSELDLSIDKLLRGIDANGDTVDADAAPTEPASPDTSAPAVPPIGDTALRSLVAARPGVLQTVDHRESITLSSGVTWERLTPVPDDHVDFILVTYPPGASSSEGDQMLTHSGKEYWYILSGRFQVRLVFDEFEAGPEDSFAFECTLPHQFHNAGDHDARAVVMIVHNVS